MCTRVKGNLSRRRARQIALQILYQIDVTNSTLDHALNNLLPETNLDFSEQEFCHALAMGVEVNKSVSMQSLASLLRIGLLNECRILIVIFYDWHFMKSCF